MSFYVWRLWSPPIQLPDGRPRPWISTLPPENQDDLTDCEYLGCFEDLDDALAALAFTAAVPPA